MDPESRFRWKEGETECVYAAVDAETVIRRGDLVFQEEDDVRPASMVPFGGSYDAMREYFARRFLGVAMQESPTGAMSPVKVATAGRFEFDAEGLWGELGDLIGVEAIRGGCRNEEMHLMDQKVCRVHLLGSSIGRLARREPKVARSVLVQIRSRVMHGMT